jgi:hypothetical protein
MGLLGLNPDRGMVEWVYVCDFCVLCCGNGRYRLIEIMLARI